MPCVCGRIGREVVTACGVVMEIEMEVVVVVVVVGSMAVMVVT